MLKSIISLGKKPQVLANGSALLDVWIHGMGNRLHFRDTYLYMNTALRNLADTFQIESRKEFFPMKLLRKQYLNTVIPWPEKRFYGKIKAKDRAEFDAFWLREREIHEGSFDWNYILETYCVASVDISIVLAQNGAI